MSREGPSGAGCVCVGGGTEGWGQGDGGQGERSEG